LTIALCAEPLQYLHPQTLVETEMFEPHSLKIKVATTETITKTKIHTKNSRERNFRSVKQNYQRCALPW